MGSLNIPDNQSESDKPTSTIIDWNAYNASRSNSDASALRLSFDNAQSTPSKQAADVGKIARKTGFDSSFVSANQEQLSRQRAWDEFAQRIGKAPVTQKFLSNHENMKVAYNDSAALSSSEQDLTFLGSMGRGVDQLQGNAYAFTEVLGELSGSTSLTDFGATGRRRNLREAAAFGKRSSFSDISGVGDFGQWLKETFGEQLPQFAPNIASAAVGAAVGSAVPAIGTVIGGMIGAFLPSLVLGTGETQTNIKSKDESVSAPGLALGAGALIGTLDGALPGKIGSKIAKSMGFSPADAIADVVVKKVITLTAKRLALSTVKDSTLEGVTEAVQEVIGEVAASRAVNQDIDTKALANSIVESFAAGFFMGGSFSAVGDVASNAIEKRRATQAYDVFRKINGYDSALRKNDPVKYGEIIGAQMRKNGVDKVTITEDGMKVLEQSGFDVVDYFDIMGVTFDEDTVLSDGVVLTPEQYAQLPKDTTTSIEDHARFGDNQMSMSEAAGFQAVSQSDLINSVLDGFSLNEKTAHTAERDIVQSRIEQQLLDAGKTQIEATSGAEIAAASFAVRAERSGSNVLDLYNAEKVFIRNPDTKIIVDRLSVTLDKARSGQSASNVLGLQKTPVLDLIIKNGGLNTEGPMAGELRSIGLDMESLIDAGLSKKEAKDILSKVFRGPLEGAVDNLDNVPQSETDIFDSVQLPEDQNGLISPDMLIEAVRNEIGKDATPQRSSDEQASIDVFNSDIDQLNQALENTDLNIDSPEADIRALLGGISFNQDARASIQLPSGGLGTGTTFINLSAKSDPTSYIHENGHLWLEQLKKDAEQFGGNFKKDFDSVIKWMGQNSETIRRDAIEYALEKKDQLAVDALTSMKATVLTNHIKSGDLNGTETGVYNGKDGDLEAGNPFAFISRAMHEQFARGTEDYFKKGNAPSIALQKAFNHFRAFMISIYSAIEKRLGRKVLDVEFSQDVRDVMDRMLATDAEIELMKEQYNLKSFFESAKEMGMTQKQFEAHQLKLAEASDEAKTRQLKQKLNEVERVRKEWWKREEIEVKRVVEEDVSSRPNYQALYGIVNNVDALGIPVKIPFARLDRKAVDDIFENTVTADRLPKIGSKKMFAQGTEEGLHPDVVAPMFGYETGKQMLEVLLGTVPFNTIVSEEVSKRMRDVHGDLNVVSEALVEASASIHFGDKYGEALLTELNAISDSQSKIKPEFIKQWASEQIEKHTIRTIKPATYEAREKKFGREAGKLLRSGDRLGAQRAKFKQLMNHAMAKESHKIQKEIKSGVKNKSKYNKRRAKFPGIDAAYVDKIKEMIGSYGLGPKMSEGRKTTIELAAFNDFIKRAENDDGAIFSIPDVLKDEENSKNYQDMTLGEFRQLMNAVDEIAAQGKNKKKLIRGVELRDQKEAVVEVLSSMERLKVTKSSERKALNQTSGVRDDFMAKFRSWDAAMTKIEFLVEFMDGKVLGPARKYIFEPFVNASFERNKINLAHGEIFRNAFDNLPKEVQAKMHVQEWNADLGRNMTRSNLIHMALNAGNESNLSKMVEGSKKDAFESASFTEDQVIKSISVLTKEEIDFVNTVWGMFETMSPKIDEIFRKEHGVSFNKVPVQSISLPNGELTGGYFPMVYDSERSSSGADVDAKSALASLQAEINQVSIYSGMTKDRSSSFSAPVDLDISRIPGELQRHAHMITHYDAVRSVQKVIRNVDIEKAIVQKLGREYHDALKGWLANVSVGEITTPQLQTFGKFIEGMRLNATVAVLGASATTVMTQFLGISTSIDALSRNIDGSFNPLAGTTRMIGGMISMMSPGATQAAFKSSKELPFRLQNSDRDIKHAIGKLGGKGGRKSAIQRALLIAIPFAQLYLVDIPTYIASYNQALKSGLSTEDAATFADGNVRKSQGSGDLKDQAAIMAERGGTVAFTMFMTFFNTLYNIQRRLGREADFSVSSMNKIVSGAFLLFILPTMIESLVRMQTPPDDGSEEYAKWIALKSLAATFNTVPFVRDIASAASSGFGIGTPVDGLGKSAVTIIRSTAKYINDPQNSDGFTNKDLRAAIAMLGYSTGVVPSTQINRFLKVQEQFDDGVDIHPWEWVVGKKK